MSQKEFRTPQQRQAQAQRKQQQQTAAPQQRIYSSAVEFDSDTFKLSEQECQRYDSVTKKNYFVNHAHIYHTKDSGGKDMSECGPTAGHFHVMTVRQNGPGMLPSVVVGPPMKYIKVKEGKTQRKKLVPYNGEDDHTHEVVHLGSSRMKPRSANVEAAKVATQDASKLAPIPGIGSGDGLPPVVKADGTAKVEAT
jgi:hypothetical protein